MGFFGLGEARSSEAAISNRRMVAYYRRLRSVRMRLNNELVSRLSRDVIELGAKRLGIFRRGMIVLRSEEETPALMDYCLYDVRHQGRNAIDRYLRESPPPPDCDEMACLRAMQDATYALIAVLRVERGVGCLVENLFAEETRLLVDMAMSQTVQPGLVMGTRLLDFGDFVTMTGAALPLGVLDDDQLEAWRQRFREAESEDGFDPAPLIRRLLDAGASSHIQHAGTASQRRPKLGSTAISVENSHQRKRALPKWRAAKAMANRRCRCRSGKMFKNCCGKGQVLSSRDPNAACE